MRKHFKKIAASLTLAFAMAAEAQTAEAQQQPAAAITTSAAQKADVNALVDAIANGDTRGFYTTLPKVENLNEQGSNNKTPLMMAALTNQREMVLQLLWHGADVNAKSTERMTALNMALIRHHEDMISLLIESGADLTARMSDGRTPLMQAASDFTWRENGTERGSIDTVKKLIAAGAEIDARTDTGHTALTLALLNAKDKAAAVLIENGADVGAKTSAFFQTPLFPDNPGILSGFTPLHYAAGGRNQNLTQEIDLRLLLDRGADVNAQSSSGFTPLMLAALNYRGNNIAPVTLLERGADVNVQSKFFGETALMFAAGIGNDELVKKLLEKGANPLLKDAYGKTAATYAKETNRLDTETLLKQAEKDYATRHPATPRAKYNPTHKR